MPMRMGGGRTPEERKRRRGQKQRARQRKRGKKDLFGALRGGFLRNVRSQ